MRPVQAQFVTVCQQLLALGVVLAVLPGVGVLSFTWLIGIFALGAGLTYLVLAFKVRGQAAPAGGRVK